jgi:hypothetical protein
MIAAATEYGLLNAMTSESVQHTGYKSLPNQWPYFLNLNLNLGLGGSLIHYKALLLPIRQS